MVGKRYTLKNIIYKYMGQDGPSLDFGSFRTMQKGNTRRGTRELTQS